MDEATATKILENYLTGQASEADVEQALDFLKKASKFDPGLAALYRDMDLPGGILHKTAQDIMPYYLEPLARAQLPGDERSRFVAHLAQCQGCAADFLELAGFEKATVQANKPVPWPGLAAFLQPLNRLARNLRYSISFSLTSASGVRETGEKYQAIQNDADNLGEFKILFEDTLEDQAGAFLEAVVTAWRISPTDCDLQVEVNDPAGNGREAGQTVILTYAGRKFTQKTGQSGETIFPGLEIAKLATLEIEIQLNS